MIPHMGKVRRWHFVHKNTGLCSSYESYLHKIAKIKIREAFLSSEQFLLSYIAKTCCSCDCPFVGYPKCEGEKKVEFDLRRYYDTCEIEATYKQFRADLLLTSSTNPKVPPLLIEINVTHQCSEQKINDGVRIIEINIHSEDMIYYLVKKREFEAARYNPSNNYHTHPNAITLYNFNKAVLVNPIGYFDEFQDCFSRKNTIVFWLNNQGQFRSFDCQCYEVSEKLPQNVHYFITDRATTFKEILQGFSKRGVRIRNCFLCKFSKQDWWGDRLCILYKKHNLPRKPSPYKALSCPHYREDFESSQNMEPEEQHVETTCINNKFYYHICKDIL